MSHNSGLYRLWKNKTKVSGSYGIVLFHFITTFNQFNFTTPYHFSNKDMTSALVSKNLAL